MVNVKVCGWVVGTVALTHRLTLLGRRPVKVKVLGVFLGPGNLEEDNWRPRITAVENALNSWRQRSLSYKGKALVINALALSRVWYVASLIHVPRWVSVDF